MAPKRTGRTEPLLCPVCARPCLGRQGLVAHMSARHPDFHKDPAPEPEALTRAPKVKVPKTDVIHNFDVQVIEPHEYLAATKDLSPAELIDAAMAKLRDKLATVRGEIARLSTLQSEEADLARQLDEVTKSRAAFGTPEIPAVLLLNEQHEDKAKAAKPKTRSAAGD